MRDRFHQAKVYLVAHSWGTTIAMHLAHRYPGKFHSYTELSQIVSWPENDRLEYAWVLNQAMYHRNKRDVKELTEVGEPPYLQCVKQWTVLRKWLMKYKSMVYDAGDAKSPTFLKELAIMFKSRDYSLRDVFHSLVSGFKMSYTQRMIDDLNAVNFARDVPRIEVPVYFVHGRQETHVFPKPTVDYYEGLEAPKGKSFHWLEKSAHAYHPDDARQVEHLMISQLEGAMATRGAAAAN